MPGFSELPAVAQSVWSVARSTLAYANTALSANDLTTTKAIAGAVAQSVINALTAVNRAELGLGLAQAYNAISPAFNINLAPYVATLPPIYMTFYGVKLAALQAAATQALNTSLTTSTPSVALPTGQPTIADQQLTEFLLTYNPEAAPSAFTLLNYASSAVYYMQAEANAWLELGLALQGAGSLCPGTTLDAVNLMASVCQAAHDDAARLTIAAPANVQAAWNQLSFWPAALRLADILTNDPTDLGNQESNVLRYVLGSQADAFNKLLIALRNQTPPDVRVGTLLQGETLMDMAARELGDYKRWQDIAAINVLRPPYIATVAGPNVAIIGQQLFLPTTDTVVAPQQAPSYTINYLGVDLYYGPLNQPMLAWTGDFQVISGYQNLALSLGRRLQTTIGTLIYHPNFGSRIPPEVGAISDTRTLGYIGAYATSAVLSDPRVENTLNLNVTAGQNYIINVSLTAVPYGLTGQGVIVNEVLQPG